MWPFTRLFESLASILGVLYDQGAQIMSKLDEVLAAQAATKASLTKIQADVTALAAKIAANQGEVITQELVDQANALAAQAAGVDALTPDEPTTT